MARITIEDCIGNCENYFDMILLATKRARELNSTGADPLVATDNDKATVIALREIAQGKIKKEDYQKDSDE